MVKDPRGYTKGRYQPEPETESPVVLCTKPFESMTSLRLLQINHVKLEGKFKFLPAELKWLQWKGCPLKTLPSDYCPRQLAVLDLSDSRIEQIWGSYTNKVCFTHYHHCLYYNCKNKIFVTRAICAVSKQASLCIFFLHSFILSHLKLQQCLRFFCLYFSNNKKLLFSRWLRT